METSLLAVPAAAFSLCPSLVSFCSYEDTSPIGSGPHPRDPSVATASLKTRSPDTCILRCGVGSVTWALAEHDQARDRGCPCGCSQGGEPCMGGLRTGIPDNQRCCPEDHRAGARQGELIFAGARIRGQLPPPPVCFLPAWPPTSALTTRNRASDGCTAFCPQIAKARLPFPETRYGRCSLRRSRGTLQS